MHFPFDIYIGWPQGIYLGLTVIGIFDALDKHNKPKYGKHDAGSSFFATGIVLALLMWGGFFN
jgi:hypothetical protein